MRWYQPYWATLKDTGRLEVEMEYTEQPRLFKAIRKEYYKDLAYQAELAEQGKRCRIYKSRSTSKLIMYTVVE